MEDMTIKGNVTVIVAEETVDLAHGRILSFITPHESTIVHVEFFDITIFEGATGLVKMASFNVGVVVFVTGAINLVRVAEREPSGTRCRQDSTEFSKERVLIGVVCRPVDNGHCEFQHG